MRLTEEQKAARQKRNWLTFALIVGFMLLVFAITIIQMGRAI